MIKNPEAVAKRIAAFIREEIEKAGLSAAVVGISGGVDSALTAALAKLSGKRTIVLQMPCVESDASFTRRSSALIEALDLGGDAHLVNIHNIYTAYIETLPPWLAEDRINQGNLRARIRANILHAFARSHGGLVVGTGNLAEDGLLGYFTKYGDGAVDISPIGDLYKSEVYELARHLGVPDIILDAPPSAGLWEGQTDEGELGFSYDDAERWHRGEEIEPSVAARIERMHKANAHKMLMPPVCRVRDMGPEVIT